MICTSIRGLNHSRIIELLGKGEIEMAEIRLDLCNLSDDETAGLFEESELPLVATCRPSGSIDAQEAGRRLAVAARGGARYVDLEIDAPAPVSRNIQKICRESGAELIRSYHNFVNTPDEEYLEQVLQRCFRYGAHIAKIVTRAEGPEDMLKVFNLYEKAPKGRLIAFCMGPEGRESRFDCLKKGAPFTYAALSPGEATAEGQWTAEEMREKLYGSFNAYKRRGLRMPSSKSFAQRAIIAAALAGGTSRLGHFSPCDDSLAALRVAKELGAEVAYEGETLVIKGAGLTEGSLRIERLNAGESGLLSRLMIPLLSCLGSGSFVIEGEKTLLRRPLEGAADIMAAFGVMAGNEDPARGKTVFIPAAVRGKLIPGLADISGKGGSQLISGLLMSLPLCGKDSTLCVWEPRSLPYMFITLDLLKRFGIQTRSEMEGDEQMLEQQDWSLCSSVTFKVRGGQRYKPAEFDLEADWSAAAVYLIAGAVFGLAEIDNLDCASLQADLTIMDILVEAGASVSQTEDGKLCACKAPLEAFEADLNNAPDLFGAVSVLASFCRGRSVLKGVGRIRGKESDRAAAILEMLDGLGVEAAIEEDNLVIEGVALSERLASGKLLKGGQFTSHHDHRMAMALRLASLGASSPVAIDDEECLSKSFPGFKL